MRTENAIIATYTALGNVRDVPEEAVTIEALKAPISAQDELTTLGFLLIVDKLYELPCPQTLALHYRELIDLRDTALIALALENIPQEDKDMAINNSKQWLTKAAGTFLELTRSTTKITGLISKTTGLIPRYQRS